MSCLSDENSILHSIAYCDLDCCSVIGQSTSNYNLLIYLTLSDVRLLHIALDLYCLRNQSDESGLYPKCYYSVQESLSLYEP